MGMVQTGEDTIFLGLFGANKPLFLVEILVPTADTDTPPKLH